MLTAQNNITKQGPYHQEVQDMIGIIRESIQKHVLPRWKKVKPKAKTTTYSYTDLVTQADLKASEYILERVRIKFPGSYSEECKYADRFSHDLIWQIDPVDGTQEFCEQYADGYTTLASLLKRQTDGTYWPVASIVYLPAQDKLWYCDGASTVKFLHKGKEEELPKFSRKNIKLYQRKVDHMKGTDTVKKHLEYKLKLPTTIIECGASGAGLTSLLEGTINLIFIHNNHSKDWDLAPAIPMVKALGGFVCNIEGKEFTNLNRPDEPGMDEPYNLRGYVISFVFEKDEIMTNAPKLTAIIDDRLGAFAKGKY